MPVRLRSQPSCHASLKFAGYSNLLNGDILKMSNLKLSQPGVIVIPCSLKRVLILSPSVPVSLSKNLVIDSLI